MILKILLYYLCLNIVLCLLTRKVIEDALEKTLSRYDNEKDRKICWRLCVIFAMLFSTIIIVEGLIISIRKGRKGGN